MAIGGKSARESVEHMAGRDADDNAWAALEREAWCARAARACVDVEGDPLAPESLLALRVCDPSCRSGAFLLAAFEVLVVGLEASLTFHRATELAGEALRDDRRCQVAQVTSQVLCGVDRDRGAIAAAALTRCSAIRPGKP